MTKAARACVVCSKLTKYICVDCLIDKGLDIHICEHPECKEKHLEDCSVKSPSLKYKYIYAS